MAVGLSTTFQLFQSQRDLARQRQQELSAMIDYNRRSSASKRSRSRPVGGAVGRDR